MDAEADPATTVATALRDDGAEFSIITDARLRLALDAGRMAIWSVDSEGRVVVSPEFKRLLRLPPDEHPTLEQLLARYYPGELERVQQIVEAAAARNDRYIEWEYRHLWPNDEVRWLLVRAELMADADGQPAGSLGVIMDITERKNAEIRSQALGELAERLRELDDTDEMAFAAAQTLGETLGISRAGYGRVNLEAETITIERDWNAPGVQSLAGVLHFRDYGSYIEDLKRGETVIFSDAEKDPRTRDTAEALKAISAQSVINMPVREEGGLVALLYLNHASAREWTEEEVTFVREVADRTSALIARREAEAELRRLNESLEHRVDEALAERKLWADLVESSDALIGAVGTDYRILAANKPFSEEFGRIHGVRPRLGDDLRTLVSEQAQPWLESWQRALDGEEFSLTAEFTHANEEHAWYELRFTTLRSRDGTVIGAFQYGLDVSERMRTQAELQATQDALRQAQKMEAVGQLTGGIAHDFNNLLAGITGSLELIERRLRHGRTEDLEKFIGGALTSAQRAAALTQRLLAFSRRQTLDPKPTDVNRLVSGMEELVRRTVGPGITVEISLAGDLWMTRVDAAQLESALLNLAINGRDAMPHGGKLTVETSNKRLDAREARDSDLPEGEYVSVCVTDTGTGIAGEIVDRIFDPFFTTKPIGQGTGLGLSMIHGFLRQSGGQIRVITEEGHGTTMCLYLPRFAGRVEEQSVHATAEIGETGAGETVLVIDDEATVRMLIVEALAEAGYAALEAEDGPSGLRILESGIGVDLLITDVGLPGGMNGRQVADVARASRPGLKVLFVTGYAENAAVGNGQLEPGMEVVTKPFAMSDLANRITQMIGSARNG